MQFILKYSSLKQFLKITLRSNIQSTPVHNARNLITRALAHAFCALSIRYVARCRRIRIHRTARYASTIQNCMSSKLKSNVGPSAESHNRLFSQSQSIL